MLSIERCRKILGKDCTLTDEELKMFRFSLEAVLKQRRRLEELAQLASSV